MKLKIALGALAALLVSQAAAQAAELQPAKPVPTALYSGRWYEIARTPNKLQADCVASTTDFSGWKAGAFSVVQTCHRNAPTGPTKTISLRGHVLPASDNAKMQVALLGGLINLQYWILDHAADNAWLIMTTPNDRYVWLMSRQPVLDAASRTAALGKLQAMGFDLSRLSFPQQAVASR